MKRLEDEMKKALIRGAMLLPLMLSTPSIAQPVSAAANEEMHVQLRALKDRLVSAVNKKDEASLVAELDKDVWFTAMNNETFHGLDGAKKYYAKMLVGSSRIVENMSLTATPDDLAVLYADGKTAVSTGASNAHFKMMGGSEFDVPLRWTATLVNNGGKWAVASAHFSANMFENPIMTALERFSYWLAGGLGLAGLVLGWMLGRARRKTA
jgi:ketosteroid isomerase-like protein